jgi:hypothetical protein
MTFLDLSRRDAEDILDGGLLPGRADLACVLELTAFMRVSGEVEPAPPMSADLICQIDAGSPPTN